MPGTSKAYQKLLQQLAGDRRRWVVTGAAGFIGSALVETLLANGQEVVGLDNFATGHRHNIDSVREGAGASGQRYHFIEGNICDADTCAEALSGADYVLHQAALGSVPRSIKDPMGSHRANVDGFLTLILAARDAEVKRFVYASSSSVYGDHPALPKVEEQLGRPLSPYAVTKLIDELYARVMEDCYDISTVGLRYFNVFGRRQDPEGPYAAVIPRWISALAEGQPCQIYGDGDNSRDFCYVDNAVQANLLAATSAGEVSGRVFNVGCRGRTNLKELFALIRERVALVHPQAAEAEPEFTPPRPGDVLHSQASIDALATAAGYEPTHEVAEGLDHTVRWFLDRTNA